MTVKTLESLNVEHDYYCNDSNYYSNEPYREFDNFNSFFEEFGDADVDMNLVFRWDLKEQDDSTKNLHIYMIHQRKGLFSIYVVKNIQESDVENIVNYLQPHFDKLKSIWQPFN